VVLLLTPLENLKTKKNLFWKMFLALPQTKNFVLEDIFEYAIEKCYTKLNLNKYALVSVVLLLTPLGNLGQNCFGRCF